MQILINSSSSWDQITQVPLPSLFQTRCSPDPLLPRCTALQARCSPDLLLPGLAAPQTRCSPDALLPRLTAPQIRCSLDALLPRHTAPQTRWHSECSDLTSVLRPKTPAPQLCYIPASCFPNSVFYRGGSQGQMKHHDSLLPPNAPTCEFTINPCMHPCIQQSPHAPTQACMYPLIQPPSSPLSNCSTAHSRMYPALFPLLIGHLLILPTPHYCPPHPVYNRSIHVLFTYVHLSFFFPIYPLASQPPLSPLTHHIHLPSHATSHLFWQK